MIDVKVLRAAGLTDTQIVAVVEATTPIIAELNELRERLTEIREQNRKRKQNQRSRHVTSHVTSHVTVEKPNGINGHVPVTPENGSILTSLLTSLDSENHKQERKEVRNRAVRVEKFLLPDDWCPQDNHAAWVKKRHPEFSDPEVKQFVDSAGDTMRHWAHAGGHKRVDWDAQLFTFLKPRGNGHAGNDKAIRHNGFTEPVSEWERQPGESLGHLAQRLAAEARRRERAAGIMRPDDLFGSNGGGRSDR